MPAGLTPIYRIRKGDVDITDKFNDRTTQIEVKIASGNGDSDTFSIVLDDRDFQIELPQTGSNLTIELGYEEVGLALTGLFEINEIHLETPPQTMKLVGTSAGMKSTMKSPTIKEFADKTLGDIINEIAKKGGVSAEVAPEFRSLKVPFLNQFQSGFHVLHELELRFGAVAKFEYGKLVFAKRDSGESFSGMSLPMLVIRPEHLGHLAAKITDRNSYTSVKAAWWDANNSKRVYEEIQNGVLAAQNKESGGDPAPFQIGKMFNSKEEAIAAAKARVAALNRARGEVTVALAKGDPWIRAQMPVIVAGLRDGMNGAYVIDTVTHTYVKGQGIMTTFLAKPSGEENNFEGEADDNFYLPRPGEVLGDTGKKAETPATTLVPATPVDPASPPEARPSPQQITDTIREQVRSGAITTPAQLRDLISRTLLAKYNLTAPNGDISYEMDLGLVNGMIQLAVLQGGGPVPQTQEGFDQAFIDLMRPAAGQEPADRVRAGVDALRIRVRGGQISTPAQLRQALQTVIPGTSQSAELERNWMVTMIITEVADANGGTVSGNADIAQQMWIDRNRS